MIRTKERNQEFSEVVLFLSSSTSFFSSLFCDSSSSIMFARCNPSITSDDGASRSRISHVSGLSPGSGLSIRLSKSVYSKDPPYEQMRSEKGEEWHARTSSGQNSTKYFGRASFAFGFWLKWSISVTNSISVLHGWSI